MAALSVDGDADTATCKPTARLTGNAMAFLVARRSVRVAQQQGQQGLHGLLDAPMPKGIAVNALLQAAAVITALLTVLVCSDARAESLQCNGTSASEGDSRLSVLYKCGEPRLRDSYCAPVFQAGSPYPLPDSIARAVAPCQLVEEWLYDRGAGNLVATVRFRSGVVQSIRYGHAPN